VTAATSFVDDTYATGEVLAYDDRKPMIDLDVSTNDIWTWYDFGQFRDAGPQQRPRPARWSGRIIGDSHTLLTGSDTNGPDVFDFIGVSINSDKREIPRGWSCVMPHQLNQILYSIYGEQEWADDPEDNADARRWRLLLQSSDGTVDVNHADLPAPSTPVGGFSDFTFGTTYSETIDAEPNAWGGYSLYLKLGGYGRLMARLETLAVRFEHQMLAQLGAQYGAYQMDAVLANTTTGESLSIALPMELDEALTIDTDAYTVTYGTEGSNQYQAVRRSSVRLPLLRLRPGSNTLSFTDVGTAGVTVAISYRARWY
jgi:hypothetical protein